MNIPQYFDNLKLEVEKCYEIAGRARAKGLDPVNKVEVPQASSLAEKVVGLISAIYPQVQNREIVDRILDLEKEYGSLDPAVSLTIAEEIAREKFCKFENQLEAMEVGVRIALAYMTLGVVSSPIEGFVSLKLKKTSNGKDYFAPYYSGPIRSAGGTESAFSLVIIDYLRETFGFDRYDPTEDEVKRGIHEAYHYHERVTNLQYLPLESELEYLMKNVPVQITGDPSEDKEVYNYKDLPRIETNFVRSGFCLVIAEGLAQKAPKILKRILKLKEKGFKLSGWDWFEDFVEFQHKLKEGKAGAKGGGAVYIKDIVAGRPVFAHPSRSGSFRLRYGRGRNTGYSALAFNPATMAITDDFISVGTQLKIEKPTKGCTAAACDTIAGPIVKLNDGSVVCLNNYDEAKLVQGKVLEIIYLGDMLVPYGDFANRNHVLDKAGFVEQYWLEMVLSKEEKIEGTSLFVDFRKALEISEKLGVPLHPEYIYFWNQIDFEQFKSLINWISKGELTEGKLILNYSKLQRDDLKVSKRALELIGCEHVVSLENVVLSEKDASALLFNLGFEDGKDLKSYFANLSESIKDGEVLEKVNELCKFEIKDKAGTFIGARMGRPEKAKLRKLIGSPHVLFPVGSEGGRLRSVIEASNFGVVGSDFPNFICDECKNETVYPSCEKCGKPCRKIYFCYKCNKHSNEACKEHDNKSTHSYRKIDMKYYFDTAKKLVGLRIDDLPVVIKGVRGTTSTDHSCENLAKGLLRAKYNLNVNKDGTVRYDISEMPLTHFKPLEIGTNVEKLISLGYVNDIYGNKLERDNQILEIFPHDVVLPACPDSPDEMSDVVFHNICNFVDDELDKLYGLERFFKLNKKEDIVGSLLGCIAPHNCAAVVGRVIGFSKVQALLASPYMHAAMRRDCDGDEAAVMLLMDLLLNFSKKFLPSHRGGTQDAPLVLNTRMRAGEVDDMIFDVDVTDTIPLRLYEAAEEGKSPYEIKMERVVNRLGGEHEFDGLAFSYDTSNLNDAPLCSSYKTLPTMADKVAAQMKLCSKIRAVDTSDVARLIIERHFIRDIRGNLRKFSQQVFRCVGCNEKFRRPPLVGKCTSCGGKIIFTISEGSIIKYMQAALDLARTYKVSPYLLENLEIVEKDIHSIFGKEKEKQLTLSF